MPALASDLRKALESTVVKARDKAEGGARDALTALAVDASEPFGSMSEEERKLRNRLRARGRQLGDQLDRQKATQSIERLVREMAYEHWHRMLFARFLAENQLLIEPKSGVSISLDECEELAAEEGTGLWGLAAQFAQEMLPEIFRVDDPVLAAKLPLEIRQQLQCLVAELEAETFTASDSLGWTYQFWQTKRKKEVNDSGVKIGVDEISPVTQLFTEDYMVDFLLDNTLGAWHAGKVLAGNPQLAATALSEEELRQAVALPGCPWSYLRFFKSDDGAWTPAAGTFEGCPRTAAELKCLDPCMGSGHFVVAMFERLVALRIQEEGLSEQAAVVIEINLFGLEIDPRCTQIGAFNLALAAWRRVGHCKLPEMNLACSGLAPNTSEADWLALAGDIERLRNGMARLYRLFDNAAVLGSLINPIACGGDLLEAAFYELQPLLDQVLVQISKNDRSNELAVAACGLTKAANILARKFTFVATNVPYLGFANQSNVLQLHIQREHLAAKSDLATAFIERCLALCSPNGIASIVSPQSWFALAGYKEFRGNILRSQQLQVVAKLGSGAFGSISGERVNVSLCSIQRKDPSHGNHFSAIDASQPKGSIEKSACLQRQSVLRLSQGEQTSNPDSAIVLAEVAGFPPIGAIASVNYGSKPGQTSRVTRFFWELPSVDANDWRFMESSPTGGAAFSGKMEICFSQERIDSQSITEFGVRGKSGWGKRGVIFAQMGRLNGSMYLGEFYPDLTYTIIPRDPSCISALFAYIESGCFHDDIRAINPSLKITRELVEQLPYDEKRWRDVASQKYPDGPPLPVTDDPSQWIFSGFPAASCCPLHVGVARLLGYRWPRQVGSNFLDCPELDLDCLEILADDDGIVCLAPVRGEASAVERLRKLLAAALGEEWSAAKERELLLATAVDNNAKKPEPDLDSWLRNSFFSEHCKLFRSRPFIWQIWDGNPNGFSALVNYHKLAVPKGHGRKTLELLTYTYLGDWIDRQKLDQAEAVNGADDRLAAALDLQGQLKKILDGEPPYDIFIRWKPLHQQAIGWDPDVNDGVRLNIRPFLNAQLHKGGKTGAGILRAKPGTIKWAKDRGKEPMRSKDDFPWFSGWDENSPAMATDFGASVPGAPPAGDSFDGNRWNDLHYSRAAKEAARVRHAGE
jgi:hypothetical protein